MGPTTPSSIFYDVGRVPAGTKDWKTDKNWTGPLLSIDRKPIGWIWNFQKFEKFWNKNPKKTRHHFKNFGRNKIQNSVVFRRRKFEQVCSAIKSGKNRFDRFLLTQDHMGLILFLPYLSRTHAPPPIASGAQIIDLRQVAHPSILRSSVPVSRQYRPVFGANLLVFYLISSVRVRSTGLSLICYLIYVIRRINDGRWWFVVKAYVPQGCRSIC
jgi:hypothetical protein